MNENVLKFYKNMAEKEDLNEKSVKLNAKNDFSEKDAIFLNKYLSSDTTILDIGSGTGLIINKIHSFVKKIVAVEPFIEFSQFIKQNTNIEIITANYKDYHIKEQFDLLTCFGFCHYLDEKEIFDFYKKFYFAIKDGGKIIIKNQFGVNEDVIINKYSEELKTIYYSEYRTVEKEKYFLAQAGFKNFEVFDIYPAECNRWDNTHFFAIVAEK